MHTDDTTPATDTSPVTGATGPVDGVVEAARAIRPYLDELVGPRAAAGLDRRLAETLLDPADTPERTAERARGLRGLLGAHPATRRFLTEVLTDPPWFRPPYQQPRYHRAPDGRRTTGSAGLLGDPHPTGATRYTCPRGDYVWYRPDIGTPVPDCPTDQVPLVRS